MMTTERVTAIAKLAEESPMHLDPTEVLSLCEAWREASDAWDKAMEMADEAKNMASTLRSVLLAVKNDLDAAMADRDRLRAALEAVEWHECHGDYDGATHWVCPWCEQESNDGPSRLLSHAPDCQRQAALGLKE